MAGKLQKQQAIAQAISPQALVQRVALAADEAEQMSDQIAEAFVDGDTEVMGWEEGDGNDPCPIYSPLG
jgi:hypothetical protein